MARGAEHAPSTVPRADLARAAGCEVCRGWGTIVTDEGRHELCPDCQSGQRPAEPVTHPPGPRAREQ
ncbi:hypothetical protein [Streptomyces sp. DSM 118148]|uniref:hypothetical protein n=1 Tax=Streptomyces sp. DSM 118148 TaxID=3448667 RepID=UPI00403FD8B0